MFAQKEMFCPLTFWQQAFAYGVDAVQRQILFLDVLRQRGNNFFEQQAQDEPNVLCFKSELVMDGRYLHPPAHYMLLRILPPEGTVSDPFKRPFVIFDPRAGQGPGIGGLKEDSEVGLALRQGHPVYFVSFLPTPAPDQTIEAVCGACAAFVRKVAALHKEADKPCLIGNCQAGWQIALTSALEPDLAGVLILAGAPLSYWGGVRGQGLARYITGLMGGSWLTAFLSDLGGGLFDGAWLVQAFELSNPAFAYGKKPHSLYAKVDTEGARFLDFERWWGSPVLLSGDEMQFITDELFIGNHLTQGKIFASDGRRANLKNIKSPIVVFCSKGDDITPPQQALDWILDLYGCDGDILAQEQTIIYSVHEYAGHLGLFVSSTVMKKELQKFVTNIDLIEALPPGLYEALFLPKTETTPHANLASGDFVLRFEKRHLSDIRALGCNKAEDELRFEAVARLSQNLQGLYYTFFSPILREIFTPDVASFLRQIHPVRFSFAVFSDRNPLLAALPALAEKVRAHRQEASSENPFWRWQEGMFEKVFAFQTDMQKASAGLAGLAFHHIYGAALVQASLGLRMARPFLKPPPEHDVRLESIRLKRLSRMKEQIESGALAEAMIRGLLYVGRAEGAADERTFRMLELLQSQTSLLSDISREKYREMAKQQYMMLVLDEGRSLHAIPKLLDHADGKEKEAIRIIRQVFESVAPLSEEEERRLAHLESIFAPAHAGLRRRQTDQ